MTVEAIIRLVVSLIIIPLLGFAVDRFTAYLKIKKEATKNNTLASIAYEIVATAVRSVYQTFVEALKNQGTFDGVAQLEAMQKAKDIVNNTITQETKDYVTSIFGDFDVWLTNSIEATINSLKNK